MSANLLFPFWPLGLLLLVVPVAVLVAVTVILSDGVCGKVRRQNRETTAAAMQVVSEPVDVTAETDKLPVLTEIEMGHLNRFLELLSEHVCDSGYTVYDYADDMCMNRGTLYTHLKKSAGMSALEIVLDVRIRIAMMLLVETDLDLSVISSLIGYSETSSFCSKFKRVVGMTAISFRINWRSGKICGTWQPLGKYPLVLRDGSTLELDVRRIVSPKLR